MFNKRPTTPSLNALNISASQKSDFPKDLRHEIITIPSSNQFAFGSVSTIDYREKNTKIHDMYLQFNLSSVSGLSGTPVANYPNLVPSFFFVSKIEFIQNGISLDTIFAEQNFLLNQLMLLDEDRQLVNYCAGHYSSLQNRNAMAITNSTYYLPIKSLWNQMNMAILTNSHDIQIKISMANLANVVNQSSLVGTPSVSINSVNLIARITRLSNEYATQALNQMSRGVRSYLFYETRAQSFSVNSGVQNVNLVLSAITGKVSVIYFIVRNQNATTGNNAFSFNPIQSFNITGSGGNSLIGGIPIVSNLNLLVQSRWWSMSSYTSESFSGVSNANVYTYSFSADPCVAHETGARFTTSVFQGSEQIQILFPSSLASPVQIDVYALIEAGIDQTNLTIKKITF